MKQPVAVHGPEPYVAALLGLWRDLELTLARLDELAITPAEQFQEEPPADLSRLQYRLHAASEAVLALAPPVTAVDAHHDLADALVAAREATAAVAGALEDDEPVDALLYEWRGALFRVRLARLALGRRDVDSVREPSWARIQGGGLLVVALVAVAVGAHLGAWIVLGAGVLAAGLAAILLVRP